MKRFKTEIWKWSTPLTRSVFNTIQRYILIWRRIVFHVMTQRRLHTKLISDPSISMFSARDSSFLERRMRRRKRFSAPIHLSILVIEDSIENQQLFKYVLESRGARVELASNGREGIAKALSDDFDVVLMDIQMPVMNGFEAVEKLRENKYSKPIFAVTAESIETNKPYAMKLGFTDYIRKPIRVSHLLQILSEVSDSIRHTER